MALVANSWMVRLRRRDGRPDEEQYCADEQDARKLLDDLSDPDSQGEAAGGFIMPVREGILWIPYDEMEKESGEILLTDNADLLTEEACEMMADDFSRYADQLCNVLHQCAKICRSLERGSVKKTLELGEFTVLSGKLAVSDPCYDTDVKYRGELENVMNGTWHASAVEMQTGSWGRRIARLIAVHENYADEKMSKGQCVGFEAGRHHLLSKQGQGEEVRIQGSLRHFSFCAHSAFCRGGTQKRQSDFSKDIQVFRGMVHTNR